MLRGILFHLPYGQPVRLIRPRHQRPHPRSARSASGSTVAADHRARVAAPARIYVEGVHDAVRGWGWGPDTGA
ncbi:MAG: DUF3097 family protein, partial [Geodermatophilaceae bacterium]|nr:DUF3097 family protein [Geodermatophilaceae bacterium]